jgi:hypothetical protein
MEETKVSIFLYYRYRFTIENTVDIGGSRHAWAAIHHNAGFVRSKVDFHIKQAAEEVQHIKKLLGFTGVLNRQELHIISIHEKRYSHTINKWTCSR